MPLSIEKVPSGSQVFDWTVPPEWHLKRATLTGPAGELICDTNINNLHVVNYSIPVKGIFELSELQEHLHSLPNLPKAIPYVTSYYNPVWGFCISDETRQKLKPGAYIVNIDTEFKTDGGVPFAHCVLAGESNKEILLSSYLCHPSMANNELSGPLVLLLLYKRLEMWPKRRFSYRFLLNPETIGSLCFLSRYDQHLKQNLAAGLILTCVGGNNNTLRYKSSRGNNSIFDELISNLSQTDTDWIHQEFTPLSGSDERQYCSPGFNLPMGQIARTVYGQYSGYHNSLDDKESMDINQLIKSVDQIESMLKIAEVCGKPVNQSPFGEPQLGKRGLYPTMNKPGNWQLSNDNTIDNRKFLNIILTTLSMADGQHSSIDIAKKCHCSIHELADVIMILEEKGLIKFNQEPLI
ncbi:aminopeptidase [Shewanella algicola]|nr:aminopeptidase [Shewanella algicola]